MTEPYDSTMRGSEGVLLTGTWLSLLGRPAVTFRGTSTPFLDERRFQLLAYLAVEGEWVARDRLAALLWPDLDVGKARRNLRKAVFQARESNWASALETEGDRMRWRIDSDVAAFRNAIATGQQVDACALYRGPLLEGLDDSGGSAFSAWLAAERASLHAQWRDAARTALPNLHTAHVRATTARRLVHDDPFDEPTLLAAAAALAADGHAMEAQGLLQDYVRRLRDELGVDPSAAVREAILAGTTMAPAVPVAVMAPQSRRRRTSDSFVGRRGERRDLLALLERQACRVVTILGPGGIGKSRFARELLPELMTLKGLKVHWVGLEDLSSASQLLARVAQVLGATVNDAGDVTAQIIGQRAQQATLLVLDNAEHLPELAAWLQPLLSAWPSLRLVLTSRARVGLGGETLLPLDGLAVPDADSHDLEAAQAFDAVRLFELRAQRARPGFALAAHLDGVIALLERVDGMPLAIEMAADWVRLLPPAQIVRELDRSIDILQRDRGAGGPTGPMSMQAVFRRSWDLLPPAERQVLPALTVFRGGFGSEAAAEVADADWAVLASLVDRSLLTLDEQGRFGIHPLVANWAAALQSAECRTALALRHAAFFARRLGELTSVTASDSQALVRALDVDFGNCRAAWQSALAGERAELLQAMRQALFQYCERLGRWRDVRALFVAALASDGVSQALPTLRLELQLDLATIHFRLGEADRFEAMALAALDLARLLGIKASLIAALNAVGTTLLHRGDPAAALAQYDEAAALARETGDRRRLGGVLHNLAAAHKALGSLQDGIAVNEQALAVMREIGHHDGEAIVLNNLGDTLHQCGNLARAREVLEMGLRLAEERALPPRQQIFRLSLGHLMIDLGQFEAARSMLERARGDAQRSGQFHVEIYGQLRLARLDQIEGDPAGSLQRLREVFHGARSRGLESVALEALAQHADLLAEQGDAAYAQQLRAWLYKAPTITERQRQLLRAKLGPGTPTEPPAGFDIHSAEARLTAAVPPPVTTSPGLRG